jgi:hypothetical protein
MATIYGTVNCEYLIDTVSKLYLYVLQYTQDNYSVSTFVALFQQYITSVGRDFYKEYNSSTLRTSTLKMEEACTVETWATSPTSTRCNNPKTELTSIINPRERLKSAI